MPWIRGACELGEVTLQNGLDVIMLQVTHSKKATSTMKSSAPRHKFLGRLEARDKRQTDTQREYFELAPRPQLGGNTYQCQASRNPSDDKKPILIQEKARDSSSHREKQNFQLATRKVEAY